MNILFINDKSNLDSYVELEKHESSVGVFLKRNYFIIKTEVECSDVEYEVLLNQLLIMANSQTPSIEWCNTCNSFKVLGEYDDNKDIVLRFEIITDCYQGTIHLHVNEDGLWHSLHKDEFCLICHDSLKFLKGDTDEISISLHFLGKETNEFCVNYCYGLTAISKSFIIEQKLSMLDEERLGICNGLRMLLQSGIPYAIKLPDTFDAFWFKQIEDGRYLLEDGFVADLEWKQSEIVFKKLIVSKGTIESLYNSVTREAGRSWDGSSDSLLR